MKKAYLTVDFEEWYELDYLREYHLDNTGVEVIPDIKGFLDLLDEFGIKAIFFVVAEIAEKNAEIIREIVSRGHSIGCHGLNHRLLTEKSDEEFSGEISKAKDIIENIAGCRVKGYRASCFSMERDKLDLTEEAGFSFDSSKIAFKQHPLYRNLDLTGFDKLDNTVYRKGAFFEYEISTIDIGRYSIPISGGGYQRLFPFWLLKILIGLYFKKHNSIVFYEHPFEMTDRKLPLPDELSAKDRFRCLYGRKHNLKKMRKLITFLIKRGVQFASMEEDVRNSEAEG